MGNSWEQPGFRVGYREMSSSEAGGSEIRNQVLGGQERGESGPRTAGQVVVSKKKWKAA